MFTRAIDDQLSLRPFAESDAEAYFALLQKNWPRLAPWFSASYLPESLDDMKQRIAGSMESAAAGTCYEVAILWQGLIAGRIVIFDIDRGSNKAEFGYWIDSGCEGKGIATRACRAFLEIAFSELGLNRIQIRTHPDNARSVVVADRLGFVYEGRLRQDYLRDGEYEDSLLYAVLRGDWK